MEQELIYKTIGVIGCGASGGLASILLTKNPYIKVTAFDGKEPFTTLLPTGGGRCNITNAEEDLKEFVKNYPRGEKFLLSVFSRFSQKDTRKLFENLGIKTFVQKDKRVFPVSESAVKTVKILKEHLNTSNFSYVKENVKSVIKEGKTFKIITDSKKEYTFDNVIISTGGKGRGFEIAKSLGHKITELKPSLCALDIEEKYLYKLSGMTFNNVEAEVNTAVLKDGHSNSCNEISPACKTIAVKHNCNGDIMFAHKFITGPCIFKISSLSAYDNLPFEITLRLTQCTKEEIESEIKNNQKKSIKNVFSTFAPEAFIQEILNQNKIDGSKQTAQIKKSEKEILINSLINLKLHVTDRISYSEIVTAGGVDLNEINPKTMESKIVKGLYFIGEVMNIDGFTGGFNLQNCWSGAYICSKSFE